MKTSISIIFGLLFACNVTHTADHLDQKSRASLAPAASASLSTATAATATAAAVSAPRHLNLTRLYEQCGKLPGDLSERFLKPFQYAAKQPLHNAYLSNDPLVTKEHSIGHADYVNAVAIVGNCVVTGSRDGIVRIMKQQPNGSWQLIDRINHKIPIFSLAVAGNRVVTAGPGGTALITEQQRDGSWQRVGTVDHASEAIWSVATAYNRVVTGSGDKTARITEYQRGTLKPTHTIKHDDHVNSVATDGDYVVTGSADGALHITKRKSNGSWKHKQTTNFTESVLSLAIAGNRIVAGSYNNMALIMTKQRYGFWKIPFWLTTHVINHNDSVLSVATDGNYVVTGSKDGNVSITEQQPNGSWQHKLTIPLDDRVSSVAVAGNRVACASGSAAHIFLVNPLPQTLFDQLSKEKDSFALYNFLDDLARLRDYYPDGIITLTPEQLVTFKKFSVPTRLKLKDKYGLTSPSGIASAQAKRDSCTIQ